ncbi:hypothetical protein KFE25_014384 [Diacronema lutheri]|uniref:Protein-S-isoprenylcysteine O-methyltransferase n=1 Tax=Diacronema lutheri TaxID=2081491 RepID=A0A8J5X3A4_DIALT|nr:hypothetical protein KFE25_014384 [Diacronema lutheri]
MPMIDMERDALPVGSKLDIGAFGCCGEDILLLPPFALLLSLALGGAVHGALLGAGVASGWLPSPADLLLFRGPTFAGLFLVVCALEASAFTLLMKKKTNPGFAPVNGLATDGIYHVTRNPMYVGMVTLSLAVAVLANSFPLLCTSFALFMYLHLGVIRVEERMLVRMFGEEYVAFQRRTPRWLVPHVC